MLMHSCSYYIHPSIEDREASLDAAGRRYPKNHDEIEINLVVKECILENTKEWALYWPVQFR